MSDLKVPKDELDHTSILSEDIGTLCMSTHNSDVRFIVEGETFPAHKVILAARSEYFRALLYGGLKETQQDDIELKSATKLPFKAILKYIYTGHLSLKNLKTEETIDVLALCHEFGFSELEKSIADYFQGNLSTDNVCSIYDCSRLYQLENLKKVCTDFIDRRATEMVQHESFKTLSTVSMREILKRDSFCAPEIDIFNAVLAWVKASPETNSLEAMTDVRLNLISEKDIFQIVRPAGLFKPIALLNAIEEAGYRKAQVKHRGHLFPEEDIASETFGTIVVEGELGSFTTDTPYETPDLDHGYTTRKTVFKSTTNSIVICLGVQAIINRIGIFLWDKDLRSYSYYVEVSVNQVDWTIVVNHSAYLCRSKQYLYFPERVVKYIRLVGTRNTVTSIFHVVTLDAKYSHNKEKLRKGIIFPKDNVATVEKSAIVLEGVSRKRNMLLNGETSNYDWDSGYTCHQIGTGGGCIMVQLGQPYIVNNIRLLLWDLDDRYYRYTIAVSVNNKTWETVVEDTSERKSWQSHSFTARPVVFIKLQGTANSANEVFHCVHLECTYSPSQHDELDPVGKMEVC